MNRLQLLLSVFNFFIKQIVSVKTVLILKLFVLGVVLSIYKNLKRINVRIFLTTILDTNTTHRS